MELFSGTNADAQADTAIPSVQAQPNRPASPAPAAPPDPESAAEDVPRDAEDKNETAPEDAKRKEHEESEAKRKAEWEAKQAERKAADQKSLEAILSMTDDAVMSASVKRAGADAERLTRRNMKICVTNHIQAQCLAAPAFARQVMHPRKNMVHCFRYINRQAKDFLKKEMEESDEPQADGLGGDVPDDVCYQWAEAYFRDMDAPEDAAKDAEFIPKPYYGKTSPPKPKKKEPAKPKEKPAKAPPASSAPTLFSMAEA